MGVTGSLTGAGSHSPISAKFGLGVDSTLEMEVVTPTEELVTANECESSDFF